VLKTLKIAQNSLKIALFNTLFNNLLTEIGVQNRGKISQKCPKKWQKWVLKFKISG
jgi:hypothetical protein